MLRLLQKHYVSFKNATNCVFFSTIYPMTHRVFVYGTLKRNEPNHYWLTSEGNGVGKFEYEGVTKYKYPLVIATKYNIPFLLYAAGQGHNVKGEVYTVDDTMLSNLDILEDHPNYYVREISDILVNNPQTKIPTPTKCWVYFLKNFRPELLEKPMLASYSSMGDHGLPYMDRSRRDPSYDHRGAVLASAIVDVDK